MVDQTIVGASRGWVVQQVSAVPDPRYVDVLAHRSRHPEQGAPYDTLHIIIPVELAPKIHDWLRLDVFTDDDYRERYQAKLVEGHG